MHIWHVTERPKPAGHRSAKARDPAGRFAEKRRELRPPRTTLQGKAHKKGKNAHTKNNTRQKKCTHKIRICTKKDAHKKDESYARREQHYKVKHTKKEKMHTQKNNTRQKKCTHKIRICTKKDAHKNDESYARREQHYKVKLMNVFIKW